MTTTTTAPTQYRELFNTVIGDTLDQALRIIRSDPSLFISGMAILNHQRKAAKIRRQYEEEGLLVPPIMMISITKQCNLTCSGCYMHARKSVQAPDMSRDVLLSITDQAEELGVSILVLAGGEPLVRKDDIFSMAQHHPRILFPVFTNGIFIDEECVAAFASCKNVVPIISFEGLRDETDARRGEGVYDRLLKICTLLTQHGLLFGCSVTTTRNNFERITGDVFIRQMINVGVRIFTFVEYVPMVAGTEAAILTVEQKKDLQVILSRLSKQYPALFIGFPGDETVFGGCLAAGRGFVHVSPSGDLEPCPAAPYSDANLTTMSLKTALGSPLLQKIRSEPEVLTETSGGCALRANQAWVECLITGASDQVDREQSK